LKGKNMSFLKVFPVHFWNDGHLTGTKKVYADNPQQAEYIALSIVQHDAQQWGQFTPHNNITVGEPVEHAQPH
jgi:hypothetical protein